MTRVKTDHKHLQWLANAGSAASIVPIARFVGPSTFALKGGGYPCDVVWSLGDFRLNIEAIPLRPILPTVRSTKQTHSEQDWAWVLTELSSGQDPDETTRTLASRRSDKPNPFYYAQRTVDIASARLWLTEGTSIEDVIAELEDRRQFEIPATLCSARAREIAATAQQMIRRK